MKYPNLTEIIKHHPYHISSFAKFANVTTELMNAVVDGDEELQPQELIGICRYAGLNLKVVKCPKRIMLNKRNYRHRKMINEINEEMSIIYKFYKAGSKEAASFMKWNRIECSNLEIAFSCNRASYGYYLGVKERLDQTLSFISVEQSKIHNKPRGMKRKA